MTEDNKKEATQIMRELNFRSGDKIKVFYKIKEGDKTRIQPFEGLVIAIKGQDLQSKSFTVRKIGAGEIGVERIFPLQSPNIEKIEILQKGKVRRAKLYYLRQRIGKMALKVRKADEKPRQKKDVSAKKESPKQAVGATGGENSKKVAGKE